MAAKHSGITSLTALRKRCSRPEPSNPDGCWLWNGYTDRKSLPRMWLVVDGRGRSVTGSYAAAYLAGRRVPAGHRSWQTCGNSTCCNPRHTRTGTMAEWGAWHRDNGSAWLYTARRTAAQIAAVRANGKLRSMQVAREIRESNLSHSKEAAARGVNRSTIINIRKNRAWQEPSPFAGLGARNA